MIGIHFSQNFPERVLILKYLLVAILGKDKSDVAFLAEQVMVLDPSSSPQEESLDKLSVKSNSESNIEESVPVKRATLSWERTLEDVMEDEELLADTGGVHEEIYMTEPILEEKEEEPEVIEEAIGEEEDDSDIVIGKVDYQVCPCAWGVVLVSSSNKQ